MFAWLWVCRGDEDVRPFEGGGVKVISGPVWVCPIVPMVVGI